MTPRPHDALFKLAFASPAAAAALIRAAMPPEVGDAIAWDSLETEPASFIDVELADSHSDLLFTARLATGEPALVYLLLEHQSTGDLDMPLRMLEYQLRIWWRYRDHHERAPLPPILSVVISHVPGGWTAPRSLEELLDPSVMALPVVAALVPRFQLLVEDLSHMSDEQLRARALSAFQILALWFLRDARTPERLLAHFGSFSDAWREAAQAPTGMQSFRILLVYLFGVLDPMNFEHVRAKLHALDPLVKESAMTAAEYLEEKGRVRGLEEGLERGRRATLRKQLLFKFQALDESHEARLAAATGEAIDRYLERVLTATTLAAVFAD